MNKRDFAATYGGLAGDIAARTGLDASVVLGVIAQETGWGDHIGGNNVFGISPGGKVAAYGSVPDSASAFVNLVNSERYAPARAATDPAAQAKALAASGYNPSPDYGAKVAGMAGGLANGGQGGAPSADDLIARMGKLAPGGAKPGREERVPSADDLIARMATIAPVPTGAPTGPAKPAAGDGDFWGLEMGKRQAASVVHVAEAAARGARAGYGDPAVGLPPQAQDAWDKLGPVGHVLGRYVVDPVYAVGQLAAKDLNALLGGAQAGVAQLGAEIGQPALGRDFAALPEAFPFGPRQVLGVPNAPAGAREPGRNLLADGLRANERVPGDDVPRGEVPRGEVPGEGVPRGVGAEATSEPIPPPTADEAQKALYQSARQSAEDRAGPQMVDHSAYVPGVERTEAARVFTPHNAVTDKVLRETDPEYRTQAEAIDKNNNQIMVDVLENHAGDAVLLKAAYDARDEVSPGALRVFDNEQPTDAAPLVAEIDRVLRSPEGKRTAVERALKSVRSKLFDADGNLEKAPSALYGARQHITDMLKKSAMGTGTEATDALLTKAKLLEVMGHLDGVINDGAPEYQSYLQRWHEASRPIDQMEYVQSKMTGSGKLTDRDGRLQLGRVQALLEDIYRKRNAQDPNAAKSLTEQQIGDVIAIRNELAAIALRDRLARTAGSDTAQKVNWLARMGQGPLGAAVKTAAEAGAHIALGVGSNAIGLPGAGNILVAGTKASLQARAARAAAEALRAEKTRLLNTRPPPDAGAH